MFRLLRGIFWLNLLEYILLFYLINRQKHNVNVLPQNLLMCLLEPAICPWPEPYDSS